MDIPEEPLNLTTKKMPVSLDFNQNIKTVNIDFISRDSEKQKLQRNANQEGCLDLSKSNNNNCNKQVNADDTKNKRYSYENMKNQQEYNRIYDDVYKHSYIYENLSNTYPENIFSAFRDNKFLASWYANSLLYLNLARADVEHKQNNSAGANNLNNSADKKPINRKPSPHFELIKNETKNNAHNERNKPSSSFRNQ